MSLIGNILWFILGGFIMGLTWLLISGICFITVVGIPWGRACFNIALFSFAPFGQEAIERSLLSEDKDIGSSALGTIGNIIWFIFAGLPLAIAHLSLAIASFLTIIGIPFGIQHAKLTGISLMPIGKAIVPKEQAVAARKAHAAKIVARNQAA